MADSGSYDDVIAILNEGRREAREHRTRTPIACPRDGTPLKLVEGDILRCPYDGWEYPRDVNAPV